MCWKLQALGNAHLPLFQDRQMHLVGLGLAWSCRFTLEGPPRARSRKAGGRGAFLVAGASKLNAVFREVVYFTADRAGHGWRVRLRGNICDM